MAVSGESHQVKHLRNPGNKKKEDRKGGGEGKKERNPFSPPERVGGACVPLPLAAP